MTLNSITGGQGQKSERGLGFPFLGSVNFFRPVRLRHTILFQSNIIDHVPVEKVNYDCAAGKIFTINGVPKAQNQAIGRFLRSVIMKNFTRDEKGRGVLILARKGGWPLSICDFNQKAVQI